MNTNAKPERYALKIDLGGQWIHDYRRLMMVGSSDFEKGLHHFGGEDGGDHLLSDWGMDEDLDPYEPERHYSFQDAAKEAKDYARRGLPHKIVRAQDCDDSWFVITP